VRRSSRFSAGASPRPQLEQRADLLRLDARHGEYRALEIVGVDEVEAVGTDGFLHRHVEHPLGGAIGPPNPSLRIDQQRRVGQPGRDGGEERSIDGRGALARVGAGRIIEPRVLGHPPSSTPAAGGLTHFGPWAGPGPLGTSCY
jgi:hypothetical protein